MRMFMELTLELLITISYVIRVFFIRNICPTSSHRIRKMKLIFYDTIEYCCSLQVSTVSIITKIFQKEKKTGKINSSRANTPHKVIEAEQTS